MIQGSMVALVTPMNADNSLDWASLHKLVDWHLEQGTHAIVAVGTTGESATLTVDEHLAVIKKVVDQVHGRIPVIAGTGANSTSDFKGDSKADQSNSLTGDISVNVLRVMSNGNLVIRGEKWLTLNTGKEFIRLTGVIRAEDIDSRNTVESTKIANARIEYSGTGATHGGQGPGWLTRFFNGVLWPF